MNKIKLTQGKFAIVDDEDFEYLNQWKWYYSHGYAMRDIKEGRIYMHKLINRTSKGFDTDHINRNKLDNRKLNLRTATRSKNQLNKDIQSNNTSGYKGVTWNKNRKKWNAQIKINGRNINLGCYLDISLAATARKVAEIYYYE